MTLNSIKAGKMNDNSWQHLKPSEKTATLNDTKQANNIMGETSRHISLLIEPGILNIEYRHFLRSRQPNPLNKLPKLIAILHPKPDPGTKPNINGKLKHLLAPLKISIAKLSIGKQYTA